MVFAFVSCDDSTDVPAEPTKEEIVIDYIDSVSFEKVKNDVIKTAKGDESPILIEFDNDSIKIGESTEIPFSVSIKEGQEYNTGFHEGKEKTVKSGKVEVVVTGEFVKDAEKPTFKATSYVIVSTEDGVVSDKKYGEHKLSGQIEGTITATIVLEGRTDGGMSFSLAEGFKYALPEPSEKVTINLDGNKVDYEKVYEACKDQTGNTSPDK